LVEPRGFARNQFDVRQSDRLQNVFIGPVKASKDYGEADTAIPAEPNRSSDGERFRFPLERGRIALPASRRLIASPLVTRNSGPLAADTGLPRRRRRGFASPPRIA
jgi:hypothetical protein